MALFCLPKNQVQKLKESAIKGQINITELYQMSSKQRREFFAKYTDESLGKLLNTEFEKAMVSKQQTALTDWAKSVFKPEAKKGPIYKSVIDKIDTLKELGVLTPKSEDAFLEDLVSDKLGVSVSPEEIEKIVEKAKVIDDAQQALGADLGNPAKLKENLTFFKAKKQMDDYLQSITPANNLKVLTGTIGRGMMLASVKSPILNIGSNIEVGFTEALGRRIANGALTGSDNKLAISYVKMVNRIYQETGYDVSRMMSLSDGGASGARVLGNDTVHAGGPGKVRAVGRVVEDIVFKQLMGAPDAVFAASHFADSANINSLKLAKGDKVKGSAIMEDAMRIVPETAEGEIVRAQAILDAQVATWTNTTWASKVSEGIRKILNEVSGDLRVGDYLMPFVKTPANVIATGMDYAGMGIPKAMIKTVKAWRAGEAGSKEHIQSIIPDIVRGGLGLTFAAILAAQLDDTDFVGAYDPARAQIEQLRNSNTNSFRIGKKWISTDWLGPISVPFTAMMFARKYGDTSAEKAFQYAQGTGSAVLKIPGIADVADYFRKRAYNKQAQSLGEAAGSTMDYVTSEAYSRLVPSLFSDIAKALDPYERKTSGKIDSIKAKIPGVRQTLPVKTNIFGEQMKGEGALTDIVFGSRVRTDKEDALIEEIGRVATSEDKAVNFTNWDTSSSKQLGQFRAKVGQATYDEAKIKYGAALKKNLETELAKPSYQRLNDTERLAVINKADSKAMTDTLNSYGFVYKKETVKNQEKQASQRSLVELAAAYAKAYQIDPANAFKAMMTGEQLGKVEGNLVGLERFKGKAYNGPGGSEEYVSNELAKLGIPQSERSNYNLEHITPVAAGGSTDPSNLFIADRATHDSYTPVDILASEMIKKGKITRKEVTEIMTNLKVNKIISIADAKRLLDKSNS